MNLLGCACGGIIEIIIFGIAIISTGISAWATDVYNNRMKRKCCCPKIAQIKDSK